MVQHLLNNGKKYEKIKEKYSEYQDAFYTYTYKLLYQLELGLDNEIILFLKKSKNIRSLVLYLLCLAYNTKIDNRIIKIGIITELIHNASILHDDIIDNSEVRRGVKTFNKKYDNNFACVLGDYMLTLAVREMFCLKCSRIERAFNRAIKDMCIGEIKQYQSKYNIIRIEQYIRKCIMKTSRLYEAAVYAFCRLYPKGYKKSMQMLKFVRYFGIAFQIRDDLNNIVGENRLKPDLNDIQNGIYNSNVIYASYDYPDLINRNITEYVNIVGDEYYTEKSRKLIEKYINKAKKELEHIENSIYKEDLFTLLDIFML